MRIVQMKKMIYADNAATTKLSTLAFEKMQNYLFDDYGNPSQPYSFSRASKKALTNSRMVIAKCLGANPEEIFFTSGGTESDNWVIKCFGSRDLKKVIITSCIEHHAVLRACKSEEIKGHEVIILPVDSTGQIDMKRLESELKRCCCSYSILVSIMMVNNEIGTIEPIKEIAKICHRYGALVHTDAVQAVGHINLNVNEIGVDMLSASSHKFNGPKGIGFLYVRNGTNIDSLMDGGSQEFKKRAGTENVPAIVGMAAALEESVLLLHESENKLVSMERIFLQTLDKNHIDYIRNGSKKSHLPGLISISIKNANGEMLLHRLDLMGYCISTGSACDGQRDQVSYVIKAIAIPEPYAKGTIRISFGRMNELDDAESLANAIIEILKYS